MATSGHKFDRRLILIAALAIVLLLGFAGYRSLRLGAGRLFGDFFYPYLELLRSGVDAVSDQSLLLYSRAQLAARLEQLQETNRQLAVQAAASGELFRENTSLRRLLDLPIPAGWSYSAAEIILRDTLLWNERFSINRGSRDGITAGAAVLTVTPEGRPLLAGVVDRVGEHTADVITLYSPNLRLSVLFPATGATGITNAGERHPAPGRIPVGYLPAQYRYTLHEAALTTGFETNIPGGIKVGELSYVDEAPNRFSNALYLSGLLRPSAEFDSIRFVIVAKRSKETP